MDNGWTSNFFMVHWGVQQGCPLSLYLFILSPKILAKAIKKIENIKGLFLKDTEISQLPSSWTVQKLKSFLEVLRILESFGRVSGLRLNSKETEALWIASFAGNKEELCEKVLLGKTQRLRRLEFGYQQIRKLQQNLTSLKNGKTVELLRLLVNS